jgi:nitrogen fixation/metabolism regulation signal transduction histidine kinase
MSQKKLRTDDFEYLILTMYGVIYIALFTYAELIDTGLISEKAEMFWVYIGFGIKAFIVGIFVNYFLLKISKIRKLIFNLIDGKNEEKKKIVKIFILNSYVSVFTICLFLAYRAIKKLFHLWDKRIDKMIEEDIC